MGQLFERNGRKGKIGEHVLVLPQCQCGITVFAVVNDATPYVGIRHSEKERGAVGVGTIRMRTRTTSSTRMAV
jgi:hypothetical protein